MSLRRALSCSIPFLPTPTGPALVGLRRRVYLADALPLWKVIGSRRKSLEDRLAACTAIAPHLQGLSSLPAPPGDSALPPEEVEAKCAQLREQQLREIERQREAEARAAEELREEPMPPGKRPTRGGPTLRSAATTGRGRLRASVGRLPIGVVARGMAGWRGARRSGRSEIDRESRGTRTTLS